MYIVYIYIYILLSWSLFLSLYVSRSAGFLCRYDNFPDHPNPGEGPTVISITMMMMMIMMIVTVFIHNSNDSNSSNDDGNTNHILNHDSNMCIVIVISRLAPGRPRGGEGPTFT